MFIIYGVNADQMNEAINGNLAVVDCLHVSFGMLDNAIANEQWRARHASAAAAAVALAQSPSNPFTDALQQLIKAKL